MSPQGDLCVIEAQERFLCYQIYHPSTQRLQTIYKETFDEALEKLADPSLPLVPFEPDTKISQEESAQPQMKISFVGDDGLIWHMDENDSWGQDPQSTPKK